MTIDGRNAIGLKVEAIIDGRRFIPCIENQYKNGNPSVRPIAIRDHNTITSLIPGDKLRSKCRSVSARRCEEFISEVPIC